MDSQLLQTMAATSVTGNGSRSPSAEAARPGSAAAAAAAAAGRGRAVQRRIVRACYAHDSIGVSLVPISAMDLVLRSTLKCVFVPLG